MSWDAIGAVAELIGSLAVLSTLIYLATQIRQSKEQISQANSLARFSASKDILNQFNELNKLIVTDESLRLVLNKPGELTDEENEQIYTYAMMYCAVWMSIQAAYDHGQIDEWFYTTAAGDVAIELARWPNFRAGVDRWLSNYPENRESAIFAAAVKC